MKRLVTQFDDERTRATVATPTCCCCCCCVASIVTSTAVTVLNAHELARQAEMTEAKRWLYRIAALVVLPLAVLVAIGVGLLFAVVDKPDAPWAGVVAFLAAWPALLALLYRQLGLTRSGKVVAITVLSGAGLFVAEASVMYGALADDDDVGELGLPSLAAVYLLFVLVLSAGLVALLRRWMAK